MAYEALLYEVATTASRRSRMNAPDTRNALSNELLGELIDAFESARDDERVRCVVLGSTHEKVFSAGGNLDQFAADVPLVHKHFGTERFPRLFKLIMQLGKPTICAASGHVLAGALGHRARLRPRVAKDTATFGTPEINVGVFPFMIMALIYRNVPRKKANELMLLGRAHLGRGGARGRHREPRRDGRGVRRRGGRLGGAARRQVARADEARQGRHVPSAGHAARRTRSTTCAASCRSPSPRRTSRRG